MPALCVWVFSLRGARRLGAPLVETGVPISPPFPTPSQGRFPDPPEILVLCRGGYHPPAHLSCRAPQSRRTLRKGQCPQRPAAPRPSVGAGPRPARGPVPFVGAAFGRPGVWGPRPHGGHRGRSPLYINWGRAGLENWQTGSERNCVFPLRLPSVYQNESEKHWGARDCGFWGAEPCANVYQKSTMRTSAAQTSGFFAVLRGFLNLFQPVTGVVLYCPILRCFPSRQRRATSPQNMGC